MFILITQLNRPGDKDAMSYAEVMDWSAALQLWALCCLNKFIWSLGGSPLETDPALLGLNLIGVRELVVTHNSLLICQPVWDWALIFCIIRQFKHKLLFPVGQT